MTDDVFFAPITELNERLRKKEFSAVELTKAFGERLVKLGPRYNALALPLTSTAVKRAKNVDADLKRDRHRGPLHGIPFGAKDLLSVAGQRTTWGAKPYETQVLDETATVLKKLDNVGAPLVGKLAMIELAGGPTYRTAEASLFGPCKNPWDLTRWAGGSSSGSGAAVAAGLVPFALGSETSGSIINPAAYCGVTGLRPTYGLVSRHGAMALSWTLDKVGALCRSAEDCGHVLQVIAGGDEKDPGSAGKSFYYTPQYVRKISEIKAVMASGGLGWADTAFAVLREAGLQTAEGKLPEFPFGPMISTIISCEAASIFEPLITSGKIDQLQDQRQIARMKAGLQIPAKDYLKAMRMRSLLKAGFRELFSKVDVLIAPTFTTIAPRISDPLDAPAANQPSGPAPLSGLIQAGNLAGLPALSIPCGFQDGMPVALQIVGPAFSENLL
ncbi:MAG: Amidase, partial [Bryobacterales bacterium]|nr:Amidase [Bryobacterales bacterium]